MSEGAGGCGWGREGGRGAARRFAPVEGDTIWHDAWMKKASGQYTITFYLIFRCVVKDVGHSLVAHC